MGRVDTVVVVRSRPPPSVHSAHGGDGVRLACDPDQQTHKLDLEYSSVAEGTETGTEQNETLYEFSSFGNVLISIEKCRQDAGSVSATTGEQLESLEKERKQQTEVRLEEE